MGFIFQAQIRKYLAREDLGGLSDSPSAGLFYLGPMPIKRNGETRIQWMLDSLPFVRYPKYNRKQYWKNFISKSLACYWSRICNLRTDELEKKLHELELSLPHGRIRKGHEGNWQICWGNDFPVPSGLVLNLILQDFCLMNETFEYIVTEREACLLEHKEKLRRILSLEQDWPALASNASVPIEAVIKRRNRTQTQSN